MLALIFFMSSLDTTAQVKTSWAFNYRFQNFSPNVGTHLMLDEHGNVYNTGFSSGSPGRNDMVLIKFEENGNMQWLNRYSDTITPFPNNYNSGGTLLLDSMKNVVVGGTRLWKYDPMGKLIWSKYPGAYKGYGRIFFDSNWLILSSTESGNNSFLIRMNSYDGDTLWSRYFKPNGTIAARWRDAVLDDNGNVITTGYMNKLGFGAIYDCITVKYSNDGELLWYDRIDEGKETFGYALAADKNNNIYVAGEKDFNILTVKYSQTGDTLWKREFNGGSGDTGYDVEVDSIGNVYVTGFSIGIGIILIKYDPEGNLLWVRNQTDIPFSEFTSLVKLDREGNPYIGFSINTANGRYEFAVAKYDSKGNFLWLARYNYNNQYCDIYDFIIDRNFDVYVTGTCGSYLTTIKLEQFLTSISSATPNIKPQGYSLYQNHPNAFNPSTVISFTVPEVSNVTMSIYDMSGKLITELISSKLHEPGFYDISFNAAAFGLSSGIYFYRMQAGGYVETKRMAMVK